jgi:DNA end-binding protein Ku
MKGKFEPSEFADPYEEALVDMLRRRARGSKPLHEPAEAEGPPSNVVNLMDALRKSLGGRARARGRAAAHGGERRVAHFHKPAVRSGSGRSRAAKSKPPGMQRARAGGR